LNSSFLKRALVIGGIAAGAGAAALAGYMALVIAPDLPAIDAVTDYRPKIPLRIYTADNTLIGEFGEEHRDFVPVKDVPEMMKKAILAIEDKRFYDHGGIDWIRALGALKADIRHMSLRQGGSTITMQVAKNFFLSRDKKAGRKLAEVLLAYRIEAALTKDQILELYINQIYLGQRSYGFASASQAYFSKDLKELSVAEFAMLAGLPQNPSRNNPAVNPKAARKRQHLILKAMRGQDVITEQQYQEALKEVLHVSTKGQEFDTHAEYVAELARQQVYAQFKEEAYTRGISVYTTILKADQDAAYESVRRNVLAYDQRHGYRGPETYIDLPDDPEDREDAIDQVLQKRRSSDRLIPAVVTAVNAKSVQAETIDGEEIEVTGDGLKLAAQALAANAKPDFKIRPGAVIRVIKTAGNNARWSITQVPQVAAAFVSIDANTGGYHAMVGGFDFNLQKFNHVTQAWRQPGSAIKPFVYSAALEKGYYPATLINDSPLSLDGGDSAWNPQNDDGVYDGPVSMRTSLAKSKNVTTVRLLRAVSVPYAHSYLQKFGFDLPKHPQNLTMALGTGSVTPQQLAGAYAVFANGGYQVRPYLIAKIVDGDGKIISETKPPVVAQEGNRVLDPRNVFLADQMMREVVRSGTAAQAYQRIGRSDLAGKTGTTSDAVDGWFAGYGGGVVGVAWMGYDEPKSLGGREFGATLALPIWMDYMKVALQKRPPQELGAPEGLAQRDGEWLYSEYLDDATVRAIDLDVQAAPAGEAATAGAIPPQGEVNQPHQ
jgi:penicillin-binding protein 1A